MSAPFAPAPVLTRAEVADRVRAIVMTNLQPDIPREKITETSSLIDDLGGDSLDTVEVVIDLESTFNIELTDAAMERIVTIGDATAVVIEALATTGRPVAEGVA